MNSISIQNEAGQYNAEKYHEDLLKQQEEWDFRAASNARQLTALRKSQGYTQASLARRAAWSQGNYALYVNNNRAIGRSSLIRLCVALECNPHDIRPELRNPEEEMRNKQIIESSKNARELLESILESGTADSIMSKKIQDAVDLLPKSTF